MKQSLIILLFLLFFAACNDKKETEPVKSIDIPVAEKQIEDAIATYPDSLLLTEKLIQYYRDNGTYDKAIATANGVLQKDSLNARLWDIKAILHFEDADTLAAIGAFEKAVHILPDPKYLMSLGTLYAQTKNAKALLVADVLEKPENGKTAKEGLFLRGLFFSYAGDYPRDKEWALSYFDKCLAMDYTFMPAYLEKAIIFYDQAKYDEAIKILDKAVTLQNNFDEGYYWRGRSLEKLNKPGEAIEQYRNALIYSPDYVEAKEALARLGVK